jgi:hypothetical protein
LKPSRPTIFLFGQHYYFADITFLLQGEQQLFGVVPSKKEKEKKEKVSIYWQ